MREYVEQWMAGVVHPFGQLIDRVVPRKVLSDLHSLLPDIEEEERKDSVAKTERECEKKGSNRLNGAAENSEELTEWNRLQQEN